MENPMPSVDEIEILLRASSKPLTALAHVLVAWPEEERREIAVELHKRCRDIFLREALEISEKEKRER